MFRERNPNANAPHWEVVYVGREKRDGSGERYIMSVTVPAVSRQAAIESVTTPAHWGGSFRENVVEVRQVRDGRSAA